MGNFKYPFEKLDVWQESRQLVKQIYKCLDDFPSKEQFAIVNQIQRAVVSVPSNIAEGIGRESLKEQIHFIDIAYGSLMEVYCQLIISYDLEYLSEEKLNLIKEQIYSISNKLKALKRTISNRIN